MRDLNLFLSVTFLPGRSHEIGVFHLIIMSLCNTCAIISALHDSGPYYTHLGTARSEEELFQAFEDKGFEKKSIRIEKAVHAPREGKSSQGCPIAKYVSRITYILNDIK